MRMPIHLDNIPLDDIVTDYSLAPGQKREEVLYCIYKQAKELVLCLVSLNSLNGVRM